MSRDFDHEPRQTDRERPDPSSTGRTGQAADGRGTSDPRSVFTRELDLPRGQTRERVHVQTRTYSLNASEARMLATVGAFRVVPERDLRETDTHLADLRHLRDLGLVQTRPYVVGKARTELLTLTECAREILEQTRHNSEPRNRQTFHAGVRKPRELAHDAQLYRAYLRAADRLVERGGSVRRVVLEEDLKRDYQRFLQAANRRRRDSDGRPNRSAEEIAEWARLHQLPMDGDHVQFPDLRIEYDERDGRRAVEDVEVTTPHYRGAHAAAKARSGFSRYRATGASLGGATSSSRSGGRGFDPHLAEEMLE